MPLVRRAHWHHHLSPDDARDVVQEAFLLAIEKLDRKGNPRVWLTRVVDNLALNLTRKLRRRRVLTLKWAGTASGSTPEEQE